MLYSNKNNEISYIFLSKYIKISLLNKHKLMNVRVQFIYIQLNLIIQRQIWLLFYLVLYIFIDVTNYIKLKPYNKAFKQRSSTIVISIQLKNKKMFEFLFNLIYLHLPALNSRLSWQTNIKNLTRFSSMHIYITEFPFIKELELFIEEDYLSLFLAYFKVLILFNLNRKSINSSELITFFHLFKLPILAS
jgi:hypothetical protein